MWHSIILVAVAVAAYVAYVIWLSRGTKAQPIQTMRRQWRIPETVVRVVGDFVAVEGSRGATVTSISSTRGIWHASKWTIQVIDNQLLGLVLFDEKGRGVRIPGWHVREGLGQASDAMVLERTDALLDELREAHPHWQPKRVRGFLTYRLFLVATTVCWVFIILPTAVVFFRNLEGWPRVVGPTGAFAVTVAWMPLVRAVWRAIVRVQIRCGKDAFQQAVAADTEA